MIESLYEARGHAIHRACDTPSSRPGRRGVKPHATSDTNARLSRALAPVIVAIPLLLTSEVPPGGERGGLSL
jgi:hypothetical protein